jgi:hypothetical protein
MNLYTVSVTLAGDSRHIVANKGPVSVPEIAILKAIHGDSSVQNIRLYKPGPGAAPPPSMNVAELRESLRLRYQNALPGGNDPIVDKLFGPMGALPTTLDEIGIDAKAEARRLREEAKAADKAAEQFDAEGQHEPTAAEKADMDAFLEGHGEDDDKPGPKARKKD